MRRPHLPHRTVTVAVDEEIRLDALLVGDIQPGCEWKPDQCLRRIAFNLTCAGCNASEDYCAAHTRALMAADETTCCKCGRAGTPRQVIQVREIRGI